MAARTPSIHVFLGRPLFLLSPGIHSIINFDIYIYILNYSMEQNHYWKVNQFSASQEIPRILWNPKAHYNIHNFRPPVPILSKIDALLLLTSHLLKIHLNIVLPHTLGPSKCSLSLKFPHQNPIHTSNLPHTCYIPLPISFFSIWSPKQYWVRSIDH